ncbi:pyridoxal phosphate-dependent aminotransferase [Brockia lithotrophica]|uniref:Aminotransferase n=1 Tax=Brockia lithotrophica TaxID=933949 RepID=A0A660L3U9_9BACL|nr:pyridoxal phosphate-dependent aminotransferase [Brockia lithotrophica]RKQ88617.1 L-aspartate aminotransferase [Brockia lithotrophica]
MPTPPLAGRVRALAPSATLALTALARELKERGEPVVSFGAGEPDVNTPEPVIEAACRALREGKTKYTPSGGIRPLREAVAEYLHTRFGLAYAPEDVHISVGAKHALFNAFLAVLEPEEEVVLFSPYWVSYPEMVRLAGGKPVVVPTSPERGFLPEREAFTAALTPRTRAVLLNTPNNPTGAVYPETVLRQLGEVLAGRDVWVIADEIYAELVYEGAHVPFPRAVPELADRTLLIGGFSKSFAMTGWRLGFAAGPRELVRALDNLASQSVSCPTSFVQYAGVAALREALGEVERLRQLFASRRAKMLAALAEVPGVRFAPPGGAFYVFLDVSPLLEAGGFSDADALARALLEEEKVVVVPGTSFGAPEFVRLSYAMGEEEMLEGIARLAAFARRRVMSA